MNIALLGFGTVGSAFCALTEGRDDLRVSAVLSRRPRPELSCLVTPDFAEILRDPSIALVVEAIGGLHPAYEYVSAALRAGKHVVTANKHLMAVFYDELTALAAARGVCLRCTAAAGGGIPWLTSLSRAARLDEILAVEGILNETTNYMLAAMTDGGLAYGDALRRAQEAGLAEADPTADVEGLDPMRKLLLSANLAFGVSLREEEIPCFGIASVTPEDIAFFKREGCVCKLFSRAEAHGDTVAAFVMPTLFRPDAPQAQGGVALYARRLGRQSFAGAVSGSMPNAFSTGGSVLADCLDIAAGCGSFYDGKAIRPCAVDNGAVVSRFYCRTAAGAEISEPMSVAQAFERIRRARENDPGAFFARLCF